MLAPMAGGPTTSTLVAAVPFGFLAAGYRSAADLERYMDALGDRPFGVNLFVPTPNDAEPTALAAYAARIGADPADSRWTDDDWDAKLELVRRRPPAVVSLAFGCPAREVVASLESDVWCTVTSAEEAHVAKAAGVDVLVAQGAEAGGHQSTFDDADRERLPTLSLVRELIGDLPVVAAGGIATREGVEAALAAGAAAVQVGTAFLLADEAGTSDAQRRALATDRPTALTRAFTGRLARGIVNDFMREHDAHAPHGYPQVHYLTAPLRGSARAAGDFERFNLWAGAGYRDAIAAPAAEIVARLTP
ncbi:MAG TPA: nitronate monooxygenase [Gaiellaceae bacterium]|nr:nitronate monooxygenase [Gaiellaceae bacterium]